MTPADVVVVMPSDDEIWRAARAAAGLTGDSAVDMLNGVGAVRARFYAAVALAFAYPTAPRLTLARKLGLPSAMATVRAELRREASQFDLAALNAVRAACGWREMTAAEAAAAPLTYCGRPWTEFVDRGEACSPSNVDAGPACEKAPATFQDSVHGDEPVHPCGGSSSEKDAGAGDCVEKTPANFHGSGGRRFLPREADVVEDNDLPSAPPSPAAQALADAARAMRTISPRARIIDRREPGGVVTAALMGDPTPEQRARMAATPGEAPGRAWR